MTLARPALVLMLACLPGTMQADATSAIQYPPLEILLSGSETVLGEPITYPGGPAKVTSAFVTMQPGQETGWHVHDVPLFAYMLEGEITVQYEGGEIRRYQQGDSLLEAIHTPHNGENTGSGIARILAVFLGAEGFANTKSLEN